MLFEDVQTHMTLVCSVKAFYRDNKNIVL